MKLKTAAPKPKPRMKKAPKPIPRSGPPKKRNAQRKKRESVRAYGPKERREFVLSLPCVMRNARRLIVWHLCTHIEQAHVESGGTGRKADAAAVVPMCNKHHYELHRAGIKTFEEFFGIDLKHEATLTEERWASHKQEERGAA